MQEDTSPQKRDDRQVTDDNVDLFDPWGEAFLKDMKRNDREFEF